MKVTINEIAKITNVSKSTISRVLNESGPVSERTKKTVLDAVKALQYQPNEIARSLAMKRTKTLGLIVQDIRNPYYANACWYTERIFRKFGYTTFICNADNDPKTEESFLNTMRYRNVDGVLCIGIQENATSIVNFKAKEDIPLVIVDREVELNGSNIPTVTLDNVYGGQLAVEYLFSLGHQKIAFLTSDFTEAERLRFTGYQLAHKNRGLSLDSSCIIRQSEELWHKGSCEALFKLLHGRNRPSALFASNDYKAVRVLRILRQAGVLVPDDISVVGYDDIEIASLVHPALTTIHQPIDKMIEIGAKMLMHLITKNNGEEEKSERGGQNKLRPWLVERESTKRIR